MTGDAWSDYLAAAQKLDAVRRDVAASTAEQERVLRAAREELTAVRARLAPQRARLCELGVPGDHLVPAPVELAAATQQTGRGLVSVVAALRQARTVADGADAAISGAGTGRYGASPWLRNLLVYVPFGAVVFVVQVALYLAVVSPMSVYSALCGLIMPTVAFGLGWLTVGLVFRPGPTGRVERTPVIGAVVCFAPVLMACAGFGVLAALR